MLKETAVPGLYVHPGMGVAVSISKPRAVMPTPGIKPAAPIENNSGSIDKIARWGEDNDFPDLLDLEIERNPTLTAAIETKIDYLLAGGVEYGIEEETDNGKVWRYVKDKNYKDLLDSPHTKQYITQAVYDIVRYGCPFPEIGFTADKRQAAFITAQLANDCRWELQSNTGSINFCYINKNWQLGRRSDSDDTIKVPVIDPLLDTVDLIRSEKPLRYIFRTPLTTSKTYYPLVRWYSVKESGWLDVSNLIPKFKKALMELQMTIKHHIEVNDNWLQKKYGERYKKATPEDMQKILIEELQHFNDMFKGAENTGKNVMTVKWYNPQTSQYESAWEIKDLGANTFSGEYIDDSEEASLHINWGVGTDPTLIGNKKGSGSGSGSGSDKREAFNMTMSTSERPISAVFSPLYFIRDYNGYNPEVKFRMRTPFLQTLNQVPPAERQTTPKP